MNITEFQRNRKFWPGQWTLSEINAYAQALSELYTLSKKWEARKFSTRRVG